MKKKHGSKIVRKANERFACAAIGFMLCCTIMMFSNATTITAEAGMQGMHDEYTSVLTGDEFVKLVKSAQAEDLEILSEYMDSSLLKKASTLAKGDPGTTLEEYMNLDDSFTEVLNYYFRGDVQM